MNLFLIFMLVLLAILLAILFTCKMSVLGAGETKKMFIQSPWLEEIAAGRKTTEGRVGPDGKYKDWIGEEVVFFNEKIEVPGKVTEVIHYDNLESYINGEGWKTCAPHVESEQKAYEAYRAIVMKKKGKNKQVFSDTRIDKKGGINAIRLEIKK